METLYNFKFRAKMWWLRTYLVVISRKFMNLCFRAKNFKLRFSFQFPTSISREILIQHYAFCALKYGTEGTEESSSTYKYSTRVS